MYDSSRSAENSNILKVKTMVDRVNFEYLGKSREYQKMLHVENDTNIGEKFKSHYCKYETFQICESTRKFDKRGSLF